MGQKGAEVRDGASSEKKASGDGDGRRRQHEQATKNQKRKHKEIAPYGNYRNYYGYRIGQSFDEDPRLKAFRKEWFEGRDCLDIGCNSGIITIDIAKKFHCQSILGIDIDSNRIEDAFWNLRREGKKKSDKNTKSPKLEATEDNVASSHNEDTQFIARDCSLSEGRALSDMVSFRHENFVKSQHTPQMQFYDTIICLSVSKWIHLNWGDDGLMTFFSKVWRLLHPGGIFILEPQPWSSYKSNRLVSETTRINYQNIMFHPECFQELLLDKKGRRRQYQFVGEQKRIWKTYIGVLQIVHLVLRILEGDNVMDMNYMSTPGSEAGSRSGRICADHHHHQQHYSTTLAKPGALCEE